MVNRGFVPHAKTIPSPDMSFVRLFDDNAIGWRHRGQYVIWTGADPDDRQAFLLLERIDSKVAPIRYDDGTPVFHRIAADTPFLIQGLTGIWMAFDSDAMWFDTPGEVGQYVFLAVGGAAERPGQAVLDLMCPSCGTKISPQRFEIPPLAFSRFLVQANARIDEINADPARRTCGVCGAVHPVVKGIPQVHAADNDQGGQDDLS